MNHKVEEAAIRAATRTPTLKDVARVAGVSVMAVSRAMSDSREISESTRERVLAAVKEVGYVRNMHAASLRLQRTKVIACLVPVLSAGSAFLAGVHAMTAAFSAAGYQVMLSERSGEDSKDEMLLDALLQRRPDGIAVTGLVGSAALKHKLRESRIPVVETWDMTPDPVDMLVGFSHHDVGRTVARYLYKQGRRNVASLSAAEARTNARFEGFRDEAIALGIACHQLRESCSYCMPSPSKLVHGREGLAHILAGDPSVDGIFAGTDMVALGVLVEAAARGCDVPKQLAVVGFGDSDFADAVIPTLTTVKVDIAAVGRSVAEVLIKRIEGKTVSREPVGVNFSVVARASG